MRLQKVIKPNDPSNYKSWMLLCVRFFVAAVFLIHAVPKFFNFTENMANFGGVLYPTFLGPFIWGVEIIVSIFIIVGLWSHYASLGLAFLMLLVILSIDMGGSITGAVVAEEISVEVADQAKMDLIENLIVFFLALSIATLGPGLFAIREDSFFKIT